MNAADQPHRNWAQLLIIAGALTPAVTVAALTASYVWHLSAVG